MPDKQVPLSNHLLQSGCNVAAPVWHAGAHLYAALSGKCFTRFVHCREHCEDGRQRTSWVIGLKRPPNGPVHMRTNKVDLRTIIAEFRATCERWPGYVPGMTIEIKSLKRESLPDYLASTVILEPTPAEVQNPGAAVAANTEAPPVEGAAAAAAAIAATAAPERPAVAGPPGAEVAKALAAGEAAMAPSAGPQAAVQGAVAAAASSGAAATVDGPPAPPAAAAAAAPSEVPQAAIAAELSAGAAPTVDGPVASAGPPKPVTPARSAMAGSTGAAASVRTSASDHTPAAAAGKPAAATAAAGAAPIAARGDGQRVPRVPSTNGTIQSVGAAATGEQTVATPASEPMGSGAASGAGEASVSQPRHDGGVQLINVGGGSSSAPTRQRRSSQSTAAARTPCTSSCPQRASTTPRRVTWWPRRQTQMPLLHARQGSGTAARQARHQTRARPRRLRPRTRSRR